MIKEELDQTLIQSDQDAITPDILKSHDFIELLGSPVFAYRNNNGGRFGIVTVVYAKPYKRTGIAGYPCVLVGTVQQPSNSSLIEVSHGTIEDGVFKGQSQQGYSTYYNGKIRFQVCQRLYGTWLPILNKALALVNLGPTSVRSSDCLHGFEFVSYKGVAYQYFCGKFLMHVTTRTHSYKGSYISKSHMECMSDRCPG